MALIGKNSYITSTKSNHQLKIITVAFLLYAIFISAEGSTIENSHFADQLFKALNIDENLVFSPHSAHSLLGLALQGSDGQTQQKIENLLLAPKTIIAEEYKKITVSLKLVEDVAIYQANKIYISDCFKINNTFSRMAADWFDSEIESADFEKKEKLVASINNWVANKTAGKIQDLVQSLDERAVMVLLNAIYFKGEWLKKFSTQNTKLQDFYLMNNTTKQVETMHLRSMFYYSEIARLDAKTVEMPYLNKNFKILLILPNKKNGIEELKQKLFETNLTSVRSQQRENRMVNVALPKFKIESTVELKEALTKVSNSVMFLFLLCIVMQMGLEEIFSELANFSNMLEDKKISSKLYISKMVHKAFLEVNEAGSEAAAASGDNF